MLENVGKGKKEGSGEKFQRNGRLHAWGPKST
jgi:hypothetical protein